MKDTTTEKYKYVAKSNEIGSLKKIMLDFISNRSVHSILSQLLSSCSFLIRTFPAIEICQQNAEVNLIFNIFIIMNMYCGTW